MTALIKLPTEGGAEETRVFSLSGCHLLAMFARTPVAKAFRKRVLDALDRIAREESEARAASKESDTPELNAILRAIIDAKVEEAIATEPSSASFTPKRGTPIAAILASGRATSCRKPE